MNIPCFTSTLVFESLGSGIRSWDIDLTACDLDEHLKLFVSRHSNTLSSDIKGISQICVTVSLLLCGEKNPKGYSYNDQDSHDGTNTDLFLQWLKLPVKHKD